MIFTKLRSIFDYKKLEQNIFLSFYSFKFGLQLEYIQEEVNMEILTQSIHTINYDKGDVVRRDTPEDFKSIVSALAIKVDNEKDVRLYNKRSENTQVIVDVRCIMEAFRNKDLNEIHQNQNDIADRLLRTEIDVDKKSNLPSNIKKGNLIQTLFIDNDQYYYLIAKVENKEFVENSELILKSGFTIDKDKIWKYCKFNIFETEDSILINDAHVYVNNKAVYWANLFLELDQARDNEKNTVDAFSSLDKVLSTIKHDYPADHLYLRNTFISRFRKSETLNYHDMINEVLDDYVPQEMPETEKNRLKTKLEALPDKKHFDTSFDPVPEKVKAKIKSVYDANNEIQIVIKNTLDDPSTIFSHESNDGSHYICIKADNEETIKAFKKNNYIN